MNDFESVASYISEKAFAAEGKKVKFVSPQKWKKYMLSILDSLLSKIQPQRLLIADIKMIINSIPEAYFVEATLQIRPFRPEFLERPNVLVNRTLSTLAETISKAARFKSLRQKSIEAVKQYQKFSEETLVKQFQQKYHPFRIIVKNFKKLIELKYQAYIDKGLLTINALKTALRADLQVLTEFLKEAAIPYKTIFKLDSDDEHHEAVKKLKLFIQGFVQDHEGINQSLKKILIYASRVQYESLVQEKVPNFVTVDMYDMPEEFKIDGCYIRSINSLMEFTVGCDHARSLQKLVELRKNILMDLDEYYRLKEGDTRELEVCAEVQLEIIRFIEAKLKGWSCEIYGQLKFLELIYGDDEIGFRFEEASFMYAQLSMAFEVVGLE